MIDRAIFFSNVHIAFGRLSQEQVDGFTAILNAWEAEHAKDDPRWLAYMLATVWWETGKRMVPVREIGRGAGRKYGIPADNGHVYYGRGLVQLTWEQNYHTMGNLLNLPLVDNPDLALDHANAVRILFEGMLRGRSGVGDFTHHSLEEFFNKSVDDPLNARRVINGTDKASQIAVYHRQFLAAIKGATRPGVVRPTPANDNPPVPVKKTSWLGALTGLFRKA